MSSLMEMHLTVIAQYKIKKQMRNKESETLVINQGLSLFGSFIYEKKVSSKISYLKKEEEMEQMEIRGVFEHIFRRNEQDGYTSFTIKPSTMISCVNSYGNVFCVGNIQPFSKGIPVCVNGELVDSAAGSYFLVSEIREDFHHRDAMVAYLQSEYFKGIGEKTAEKIYDAFDGKLEEVAEQEDAVRQILEKKISGLHESKIKKMIATIQKTKNVRETYCFMQKLGVSQVFTHKLIAKYGIQGTKTLRENPYQVGREIGLPFTIYDHLGYQNGYIAFEKKRIYAIMDTVLESCEQQGHTKMEYGNFYKEVQKLSVNSIFQCQIPDSCIYFALKKTKKIVCNGGCVYRRKTWSAEINIVRQMQRMETSRKQWFLEVPTLDQEFQPSESQKRSFEAVKESGIKLILGGPGTGKTTTILQLLKLYESYYPEIKISLCAPTGRAAQRIAEATKRKAQTIHKLLEYQIIQGEKHCKNENDPIDADVIIVDEFGMVDTFLFSSFLSAVKSGSTIILCGDVHQLPSVGAGNLLRDIKNSGFFETYYLETTFRQKGESSIFQNIHKIEQGDFNLVCDDDFQIQNINQEQEFEWELQQRIIPSCIQNREQILTMTKVNQRGAFSINQKIQENIFTDPKHTQVEYGKRVFYVGDQVILTGNNYELGYFNGDLGEIKEIKEQKIIIQLQGKEKSLELGMENLDDLDLSYAITIHKSQGSEYESGCIILPSGPDSLLSRNLLFTGISRFKKSVRIYSQNNSFWKALSSQKDERRLTGLEEKMKAYYGS